MFEGGAIPVAEDSVEYHLYFKNQESMPHLMHQCNAYVKRLIGDYMWQEDPFHLSLSVDPFPHLEGTTRFGDNIEDEWFIVYILLQISKEFASEDLWISATDSDGQFLLIEAALVIPSWVTPENSENRIWISKGDIHIIPLPRNPMEMVLLPSDNRISLDQALSILRNQIVETKSPVEVQEVIKKRVDVSVDQSKTSTHWAYCFIPKSIGHILSKRPELLAHAVTSYYHRDPLQMRACKKLTKFSNTDYAVTPVRFTRILYAQLLRQQLDFVPQGLPKIPESDEKPKNVNAPTTTNTASATTIPTKKQMELGYKLVCGFEILYIEKKRALERRNKTKQQLRRMKEQIEAKKGRASVEAMEGEEEEDFVDPSQAIDELLSDSQWKNFKPATNITPSSELWLSISPDDVDDLIAQKQREFQAYEEAREAKKKEKAEGKGKGSGVEEMDQDPIETMVSEMKKFVSTMSDYSGVGEDEEGEMKEGQTGDKKKGDFDMDIKKFVEIMYGGKFHVQDGSESDSDEGDEFYNMGTDEEGDEDDDKEMKEVMGMMDNELRGTSIGMSFEKMKADGKDKESKVTDENNAPIDLDLNLVENFLRSFEAQHGNVGPVFSVLSQLKGQK